MLEGSERPLCEAYDLAMLDLDGVVYIGRDAVPGAPDHVEKVRANGMRVAFITNNALRPPAGVAQHLRDLGVAADPEDVVTSAQAAARLLVERLGAGARVALLGAAGLDEALRAEGLVPVLITEEAQAVVSGYGPEVLWRDIMRAGVRVRDGLWWVASNADLTIPTAFGVAPGHGVLVETLRRFTGVDPVVAGKPSRPLLDETIRRVGGERPLMVGDRHGHRHRGGPQRRSGLAARPHGGHRAVRAGGRPAAASARRTCRSTSADSRRPTRRSRWRRAVRRRAEAGLQRSSPAGCR